MSLIDNLTKCSIDANNERDTVIQDIEKYFKSKFASSEFDAELESYIKRYGKIPERFADLDVEFWNHHSGCTDTYFRCLCYTWFNPDATGWGSRVYKGIELYDISKELGDRLVEIATYNLRQKGFSTCVSNVESGLGYYHKRITIRW